MKHTTILACLFLAACAKDNYTISDGIPDQMAQTLHDCKKAAVHHHYEGGAGVAAGLGAAIAGAAGGLLVGIANSDDPNVYIQECMKAKGYIGTSRN